MLLETIVLDDLTLVGYWMPLMLDTYLPRPLIHLGTYGTPSCSLPAAIGAKLACPQQPVVAVCGDGGFLFTPQAGSSGRRSNARTSSNSVKRSVPGARVSS